MEYFKKMKTIQNFILEFLDDDDKQNIDDLLKLLDFQQNQHNVKELKSIMHLISNIVKNHHQKQLFLDKITQIIMLLKQEINQTFSNAELFNFFKENKRILLLLIDENILTFDSFVLENINKYKVFFLSRIQ